MAEIPMGGDGTITSICATPGDRVFEETTLVKYKIEGAGEVQVTPGVQGVVKEITVSEGRQYTAEEVVAVIDVKTFVPD